MRNTFFFVVLILINCQIKVYECISHDTYLEDFIINLQDQSQNRSETECVKTVINLLKNVQNDTLWASWIWSSMSTSPVGYLSGSRYQLGNYDQCLNPPWLESHPELRTKYCVVYVQPKGPNTTADADIGPYAAAKTFPHIPRLHTKDLSSIYWGLCLPEICEAEFVKSFTSILLKLDNFAESEITVEHCDVASKSKPSSWVNYVFITMLAALTIIAVTSTYVYKKGDNNKNVAIEIARAFSMKENLDELTRSHPGELNILDGIRFLIIFIELFVHQGFLTFTLAPYNKLLQLEEDAQNPSRWFLFGTLLGVDVFFLISGLLTFKSVIATVDKIEWQSLVKMIIKRYFRLAPLLALTLFACIVMLDHFGSGPMWYATGARTLDECKKSWWISLLLINNYFGDEVCYAPSWSIPCDFQMFFVAVILLYLYSKKRHIGIKAFAFVFALSLIMPAVTTYKHDLPAQMPLLMPMNGLIRDKYFTSIYIKTHNRIGPYLIGMALGYGMSVFDPKTYKKSISKTFSIVLVFTGFSIMVAIGMTSGWSMYRGFPRIIEILFAASYRTAFGAAFGLCFFPFVYGTVPILNDFLCWKVFRPLSRLSYGVYIFHFLLILLRFSNSRDPVDGAIPTTFLDGLGTLVFSVLLAFIAWLLVEAPVNHLCNHWLKSWPKSSLKTTKINGTSNLGQADEPPVHKKME